MDNSYNHAAGQPSLASLLLYERWRGQHTDSHLYTISSKWFNCKRVTFPKSDLRQKKFITKPSIFRLLEHLLGRGEGSTRHPAHRPASSPAARSAAELSARLPPWWVCVCSDACCRGEVGSSNKRAEGSWWRGGRAHTSRGETTPWVPPKNPRSEPSVFIQIDTWLHNTLEICDII